MKEIKPYKVALFVFGIFLVLTPIVYFIPTDGWKIGEFPVKFLTQEKMLHPVEQKKADITDLIANIDTTMNGDSEVASNLVKHSNGSKGNMGAPSGGSEMVESSTDLLMNETGKANLLKFFTALETAATDRKKISILHYGDSQIEGDRMTNFIRERIQTQFGGNGPGLVPAKNVYDTYAFNQTTSESFKRYTAFGGESLKSRKYGVMASAARFTPEYTTDSSFNLDKLEEVKGWIEISASGRAYSRARSFNNVKMHYNSCIAPTFLRVLENGKVIHEDSLIKDGKQHTVSLSFPSTPGKLRYEFSGKVSPNICGFSLEGDYGVQVSNIGMRGSSGTVFTAMNQTVASTMYQELNTKLVIMQFGGNSVPFFKDSTSVRNFASFFKSQINTVQRLNPNAMIIVIGPSDMSVFKDGQYESYKFLSYCVEQMIAVTKSSGGAYWNLYAAMGGNNSMPSWVEKGLAGKDYIHFSNGGTKIASQLFYNALMEAYNNRNSLQLGVRTIIFFLFTVGFCSAQDSLTGLKNYSFPDFQRIDTSMRSVYPFVEWEYNNYTFYSDSSPNFQVFYDKFSDIIKTKKGKLNMYHIGGSHLQADIYTHDVRTFLQSNWKGTPGERGWVFPFDLAKTNNPWNYEFSSSNDWRAYRSVNHSPSKYDFDYGLMGAAVTCGDSVITVRFKYDRSEVKPPFNHLRIFHNIGEFPYWMHFGEDEILVLDSKHNPEVGYTDVFFTDPIDTFNLQFQRNYPSAPELEIYGFILMNDDPGISYTSIGINGAGLYTYLANIRFEEQLKAYPPDFFAFSVGTNDGNVPYASFKPEKYKDNLEKMVQMVLRANPDCAILLTVPNDSYYRRKYLNKNIERERDVIIELAEEYQMAVWDMYGIMGGLGSSRTWKNNKLMRSDLVHFTSEGYHFKGDLYIDAYLKYMDQFNTQQRSHQ